MTPYIFGNRVEGSVMDLLNDTFPVPLYEDSTEYEIGTILYTQTPHHRTNATIFDIQEQRGLYQIVTDIGNVLYVSRSTLEEWYLPPTQKRLKEWNV